MSHFDKKMLITVCATLLACSLLGCTHEDRRPDAAQVAPTTSAPAESTATTEMKAQDHVYGVIEFPQGQYLITQSAKEKLNAMVRDIRSRGQIDHIKIAAWSDKEFPAEDRDLSKEDRQLAERRIKAIEDYLNDVLDVSNVQAYNMAKRSNWLARLFRTDDAELKSLFSKRESQEISDADFYIFKNEGRPSRAVVIVERDMKQ